MGRPSSFTQEIADDICERLINGESLRTICGADDMPSAATVCRWLAVKERAAFREQYAHAREMQADVLADETLDIADDGSNDWMERRNADGENIGWQFNGEAAARSRIRIDQRKWYASKLAPKKYGDKVALVGGGEGDAPIQTQNEVLITFVRPGDA